MTDSALKLAKYAYNAVRYWLNIPLRLRNRYFVRRHATGSFPFPPPALAFLVTWSYDLQYYAHSGKLGMACIVEALNDNGHTSAKFRNVLDFGCGCGRLIRHWRLAKGQTLTGVDYNPRLVSWCRANLGTFAEFFTCGAMPPLGFFSGKFDFIYAASVFTHFDEHQQVAWIKELHRILAPGGLLLITVSGITRLHHLDIQERTKFRNGELVVQRPALAGTNICGVYHPAAYVSTLVACRFEILGHEPGGAIDQNQDIYLLRKI